MNSGEYFYSKPVLPGYRANAPIEIAPAAAAADREAIITACVLLEPGGGVDLMLFQHHETGRVPGGEAAITITSNQSGGQTVEEITWGSLTTRNAGPLPLITRTRRPIGEPANAVQEPLNWQQDGRKLLADVFRLSRASMPLAM